MVRSQAQIEEVTSLESMQEELKRNPNKAENYLRLGWSYYAREKYDRATQIFMDAKDRFPEDVEILYGLALALKKNGEAVKALTYFRKVTLLAEKIEDRSRSGMIRRLAIGHANVITDGDWNLAEETWELK